MSTPVKWEGAGTKLPSGHRIIETHDNGHGEVGYAIFDQSGDRPETTHDGILWLDVTRCLDASTRHSPTVPVVDQDGRKFTVPVDTPTVLYLSRMLRWTIQDEVRGHFYNVEVSDDTPG